jgi:DNA repair protein RecO (recombination protein O)
MVHKTGGIVLHRFKYSDSKIISKIYTEEFGLQSYMFFGANTKKGRMQINILQPFIPVNLQVYHKETSDMQKAKEASLMMPISTIGFDHIKNSISLFLSEFILKVLKENEPDKELYHFLLSAIKHLDSEQKPNNFHLIFLFHLSKYMGIQPENNFSNTNKIFDLKAARFVLGRPNHNDFISEERSKFLHSVFSSSIDRCSELILSNHDRKYLIDHLIKFYNIHLDRPGKLKSLKVLTEIFS